MLVCLHFKQDSFIQFCRERHQFCKNSVILFLCILLSQHLHLTLSTHISYTHWHQRFCLVCRCRQFGVGQRITEKSKSHYFDRHHLLTNSYFPTIFLPQDRLCILAASIPCHAKNEEQMRSFIFHAFICILDTHSSIQYCYCRKNCRFVLTICFLILIFSKDARCKIC